MMGSFSPYSAFSGWNPQSASSGGMSGSTQVAGALPPGIAGGAQTTPIKQQQNTNINNNTHSMMPINTFEYGNNSETGTNVNSNQVKTFEQAKQSAVKVSPTSKD